ncbi:hypothetical protein C8R46DRAFT_331513 [Mycena filopes]|nr:hypothetical protein C8R46DRAFT_331513 [Mycena filopes]
MASSIPDTPAFESYAKMLIEASEANIARIESQIRDLERLCDRERGTIAQLRMAIAPVRKLPGELLVEVFRHTCADYTFDNTSTIKKVQALSHVCAYWRRVAITTPRLWTEALDIRLDKTPTHAYLAGLKEWLRRSAPFPIDIRLECRRRDIDSAAVVGAVVTTAHRWSRADFHLPSLSGFCNIPSTALKQLRTLRLQSQDAANPRALLAFSLAPNLDTLTLHTRYPTRLMMPWSQLTCLDLVTNSAQEGLDTLFQCPNLVTVELSIPAWPQLPDLAEIRPTTFGKLETFVLRFDFDEPGFLAPLFVGLALPVLKRFKIALSSELEWPSMEFTQFQLRSPNIESLSISYSSLDSNDLMAILRHSPTLSKLDLQCCRHAFDEYIAVSLCASHQSLTQLVPRLHSLTVVEGCYDFEEHTLSALIAGRWWTDAQLAGFPLPPRVSRWSYIFIDRDQDEPESVISPEFTAELDEYKRQGLKVEIS